MNKNSLVVGDEVLVLGQTREVTGRVQQRGVGPRLLVQAQQAGLALQGEVGRAHVKVNAAGPRPRAAHGPLLLAVGPRGHGQPAVAAALAVAWRWASERITKSKWQSKMMNFHHFGNLEDDIF